MNLARLVPMSAVVVPLFATDADGASAELGRVLAAAHALPAERVIEKLRARERLGPSSVGDHVAIPHGRDDIPRTVGALGISVPGIGWNAPDGALVHIVVALLSPTEGPEHLAALAAVSRRLSDRSVREALLAATTREAAHALLVGDGLPVA
jgi:PTS system nitrogen regulatory IIA component